MGNEIRVQHLFKEGDGSKGKPTFLKSVEMMDAFRPVLGNEMFIQGFSKPFRVVRIEPPNNPSDQTNEYFMVEVGSVSDGMDRLRVSIDENEIRM